MIIDIVCELSNCFFSFPSWQTSWAVSSGCVCCAVMSTQKKVRGGQRLKEDKHRLQHWRSGRVNDSQSIWKPILPAVSVSDVWFLKSLTHTLAPWCGGLCNPTWEISFQCHCLRDLFPVESLAVIMEKHQQGVEEQETLTLHLLYVWVSVAESQHLWDNKCPLSSYFKRNYLE